ncbi:MBL fold metallo-hydrolase [Enterococcus diestrammenae]|uniref:Phosphoribosyl 1,2-cyclic phosphate phosphodiesterase n=1 Tax=Enterococcus diestrammenae TaxID=1155073 RepID=A0ABV0F515_9ENTE|nr:MBL fold metallo-hydrolase [Enterococcus diestrammenae]KAF1300677.1 hypothetical protein BAU18_13855 [Enterococcus diestrammenae]HIX71218.1 PhnP protein [Candidatus Enterococcus stercoravium]
MKLQYFGTAAAEGVPALYCECELCQTARRKGGKDIRTRSQSLVDEQLLIDFPGDTYAHYLQYGFDLSNIGHLLVTHSHSDHFYAEDLVLRLSGYVPKVSQTLNVYGNQRVYDFMKRVFDLEGYWEEERVKFHLMTPFQTVAIMDYQVTPLAADHDQRETCLLYGISDGKKQMLYAHDTGEFPEETWSFLEETRPYYDFVSIDCNHQADDSPRNHQGFPNNLKTRERLLALGIVDHKTQFVCNHFSHNSKLTHQEMLDLVSPYGFDVAYDGLIKEF